LSVERQTSKTPSLAGNCKIPATHADTTISDCDSHQPITITTFFSETNRRQTPPPSLFEQHIHVASLFHFRRHLTMAKPEPLSPSNLHPSSVLHDIPAGLLFPDVYRAQQQETPTNAAGHLPSFLTNNTTPVTDLQDPNTTFSLVVSNSSTS
jgi:hypothetical protein